MNEHTVKYPPLYTKNEVVRDIIENMSEEAKTKVRNTPKDELVLFHADWGTSIRNYYQMWHNQALVSDIGQENPDDASTLIIETVWEILQESEEEPLDEHAASKIDASRMDSATPIWTKWHLDKKCLEIACGGTSLVLERIDFDFAQAIAEAFKTNLIQQRTRYVAPHVAPQETQRKRGSVVKLWKYPAHPENR